MYWLNYKNIYRNIAQQVRALALQARGRWFESSYSYHQTITANGSLSDGSGLAKKG